MDIVQAMQQRGKCLPLFTNTEVNSGGYWPSHAAAREISTTIYQH